MKNKIIERKMKKMKKEKKNDYILTNYKRKREE
jgi:hypothetical protein